jgi:hypothetical protein
MLKWWITWMTTWRWLSISCWSLSLHLYYTPCPHVIFLTLFFSFPSLSSISVPPSDSNRTQVLVLLHHAPHPGAMLALVNVLYFPSQHPNLTSLNPWLRISKDYPSRPSCSLAMHAAHLQNWTRKNIAAATEAKCRRENKECLDNA